MNSGRGWPPIRVPRRGGRPPFPLRETEVENSQVGVKPLVMVFGDTIFLNAEPDVLAIDLEVRLDHPMMAVVARALKKKGVRPRTPFAGFVEMTFGAGDGLVDEGDSAGQADAARVRVTLQEFTVVETPATTMV